MKTKNRDNTPAILCAVGEKIELSRLNKPDIRAIAKRKKIALGKKTKEELVDEILAHPEKEYMLTVAYYLKQLRMGKSPSQVVDLFYRYR